MDIDEYSNHTMDDFAEEQPSHMWDLPDSDIESESTISVVKKNKFVETNTNDPGYFCIKEKEIICHDMRKYVWQKYDFLQNIKTTKKGIKTF